MNVSYRWLKSLAPSICESATALAERLTYTAVPVDECVWLGKGVEELVVARVESVRRHPQADRLVICQVDAGRGAPVQVVTGAPKVVEGGYYPFIAVGQTLPGGQKIERVKLRGEPSEGMLCSERELGIGRDQAGIMQMIGSFTPGQPLLEALELDDHRLLIDVTANRPDLLGHWGVALEVAPGGLGSLALPEFPGDARARLAAHTTERAGSAGGVTVTIEDPEGCPRYMGAVIRGVAVDPSPVWLSNRLRAVGLQPINNVVDATNYVLYELNQPLHAFDLGALGGSAVVVRRARAGEHLRTLDGKDRVLDSELLVIADAERPTALAGVMGGEGSEVTERTRDLFIECAYFDPRRVRRAARGLGLDSDASYRFQRGIDLAGLPRALERVVDLILTLAGGALDGPAVDVNPAPPSRKSVGLRPERVGRLLGVTLSEEEIRGALEPIGFAVSHEVTGSLGVAVPTWRPDVEREVDLIEEVARRHGYDKFPDELRPFRPTWFTEEPYARVSARLRELLVGCGFLEAKTSPFAPQGEGDVRLLNPLSEREDHLRRDLLTGLLHRVEYNFARGRRDVSLFELGTAFAVSGAPAPLESVRLAAVWTGQRTPSHWSGGGDDFDFWDLSWIAAAVSRLAAEGAELRTDEPAAGSASGLEDPLVIVAPDGRAIGRAGRVPAASLDAPRWAGAVWGLEVEVFPAEPAPLAYRPLPVYPAVERDLALVVAIGTPAATVEAVIREAAPAWLESLSVFDVYEGESIPQGTRSLAWRLRFRSPERTLTDGEVDAALKRIISALQEKLHVATRGA